MIDHTCDTCACPTMTTVNSIVCSGYRSRDGLIYRLPACTTWQCSPVKWTVAQALAYAKFVGMEMSRPTVIKLCRKGCGQQFGGKGGRWWVLPDEFKALLNGRERPC